MIIPHCLTFQEEFSLLLTLDQLSNRDECWVMVEERIEAAMQRSCGDSRALHVAMRFSYLLGFSERRTSYEIARRLMMKEEYAAARKISWYGCLLLATLSYGQ